MHFRAIDSSWWVACVIPMDITSRQSWGVILDMSQIPLDINFHLMSKPSFQNCPNSGIKYYLSSIRGRRPVVQCAELITFCVCTLATPPLPHTEVVVSREQPVVSAVHVAHFSLAAWISARRALRPLHHAAYIFASLTRPDLCNDPNHTYSCVHTTKGKSNVSAGNETRVVLHSWY